MNVIFMGSPEFAVPALQILLASNHNIVAVYTQEPKPAGRGYPDRMTAVHKLAVEHNIKVKTPKNFKDLESINEFKSLNADIAVVVAYGLILPKALLESTKYGCINIHPSKLPRHRGAAPLQHTILAGDLATSICIIQMDQGVDTGDILLERNIEISPNITMSELHDLTANIGADLLIEVLTNYSHINPMKQSEKGASYAAKISKEIGKINWQTDDVKLIDRKIRALNPFPGTFFIDNGKIIKIKAAKFAEENHAHLPGTIIDKKFQIGAINGIIQPLILQREGKKEMSVMEFLKGYPIRIGSRLSHE